jgi:xanthine dehydrogenase accessory factor
MKNIYLQIFDLPLSDSPLVMATVTRISGSAPQKPGSSALFSQMGLVSGTVGGGIVEGKVEKLAEKAIQSKKSGIFHFNLANDISNTEEAICGGHISILIDANLRNNISVFEQLKQSLTNRIPGVLITQVTGFTETPLMINRYWMSESSVPSMPEEFYLKLEPEVKKLLFDKSPSGISELKIDNASEKSSTLFLLQPVFPPEHLVIAGAGHIGRALAHLGSLLDFEVTVIDDRTDFANAGNLPDADQIIVKDIGEGMKELVKRDGTYVVIVTRGHKEDASALKQCIGRGLTYVGMIGSKNKIDAMRLNFIENGWATSAQWDQIHAPVGLAIKSQTIEEIAVSIAAELVMVRNSKR